MLFTTKDCCDNASLVSLDINTEAKVSVRCLDLLWLLIVATRVVRRRNHSLQNCPLQVALLPDSDGSMSDDGDEAFQDCVADAEEDQSKGNRVSAMTGLSVLKINLKFQ